MYNAFISYSHAADGKLAPALQSSLERFAKPWYKIRNLNIFRDESSLAISPHLWSNITTALDQSEYLIYMASKESASSKWVSMEIEYWLKHKSLDTLLIALTDGDITWDDKKGAFENFDSNSLPEILDEIFTQEPFYIDLRASKSEEDVTLNNPIFKKEVLKLAAQLHGKEPKDLASDEVRAHKRMLWIRNSAIITLIIFLAISIFQTYEAKEQTKIAEEQKQIARDSSKVAQEQRSIARDSSKAAQEQRNIANKQRRIAEDSSKIAQEQRAIAIVEKNKAQANYLITQAQSQVSQDQTLALQLALFALKIKPNDSVINALIATLFKDFKPYKIFKHRTYLGKIIYSPLGDKFISSSINVLSVWDINGKLIKEFDVGSHVLSMAISPDGTKVLTGLENQTACLWDLDGNIIRKFEGEKGWTGDISAVAFWPDGTKILTGSYIVRMYNLDGERIAYKLDCNNITNPAFSPGWRPSSCPRCRCACGPRIAGRPRSNCS
jgi:hypothetical protein